MRPNAHAESKHRRKLPVELVDDRVVMTRMTPWSPEQGSGSDAPLNASGNDGPFRIDISVEGPWIPHRPSGDQASIVQIVDGVRRVEAHALSDTASGAIVPVLIGSFAVGAVRCEPGRATVLTDGDLLRVVRCYLQAGTTDEDLLLTVGQTQLCFRATAVLHVSKPSELVRELTNRMLAAEARLVNRLSADCGALTLVDGPLRAGTTGRRVAGYIKRTANWYLGPAEQRDLRRSGRGRSYAAVPALCGGSGQTGSLLVVRPDRGSRTAPAPPSLGDAARDVGDLAGGAGRQARGRVRAHPAAPGGVADTRSARPAEPHARQRTRGLAPPPSGQPRTVTALHRRGARRESHARSAPHDQERTGSMTERNAAMSGHTGSRTTPASPRSSRREEAGDAS